MRMPGPDGSIMHAELKIGTRTYLTDESPMCLAKSPGTLGGTSTTISLYVEDADATFDQAVEAGAEAAMPPCDMFWGDRSHQIIDPFRPPLVDLDPRRGPHPRGGRPPDGRLLRAPAPPDPKPLGRDPNRPGQGAPHEVVYVNFCPIPPRQGRCMRCRIR